MRASRHPLRTTVPAAFYLTTRSGEVVVHCTEYFVCEVFIGDGEHKHDGTGHRVYLAQRHR